MKREDSRAVRPARVVSVCVLGEPTSNRAGNPGKAAVVVDAATSIAAAGWRGLDAVVFPGGMFWLPTHIGHLEAAVRRRVIERAPFSTLMMEAARLLVVTSPGIAVIAGLRSPATMVGASGDQIAVAWGLRGVVGIGRKVWPSDADTADARNFFLPWVGDYSSRYRLLRLASGHTAILCSCYDMFGLAESPDFPTARTKYIRFLLNLGGISQEGHPHFPKQRRNAVAAWHRLVRAGGVSVALAAVHGFVQPGREVYWQRHGVAMASAALGGGLAVAAAHFRNALPSAGSGSLAAASVPTRQLVAGLHRQAWPLLPVAGIEAGGWMARLYEFLPYGSGGGSR